MCESNNLEEMTSFEVLPTQNGMSESDNSFSLVPLPFDEEGLVSYLSNASNVHSSFVLATQDLTAEEIKKRLVELMEDNESMKEKLKCNNSLMKQQLNTISAWHNKITTAMSEQQMNLKEAKEKIDTLKTENAELYKELKELQSKPKVDTGTSMSNDPVLSDTVDVQKKSKDEETLKQLLKVAEVRIAGLTQEMEKQSSEIASLKMHTEENEKEKSVLLSQLKDHEELKSKCKSLLIQVDEYEVNMKQVQDLDEQKIKKLKSKVNEINDKLGTKEPAPVVEIVIHSETKTRVPLLPSNSDRVTKPQQMQSKNQKAKDEHMDCERELEARTNLEQIDTLMAKLFDTKQKLEENLKEGTCELESLKQDFDSIPILLAQQRRRCPCGYCCKRRKGQKRGRSSDQHEEGIC